MEVRGGSQAPSAKEALGKFAKDLGKSRKDPKKISKAFCDWLVPLP